MRASRARRVAGTVELTLESRGFRFLSVPHDGRHYVVCGLAAATRPGRPRALAALTISKLELRRCRGESAVITMLCHKIKEAERDLRWYP